MVRSRTTRGEAGDFRMTKRRKYPLEVLETIRDLWEQDKQRSEIVEILRRDFDVESTISGLSNLAMREGFKRSPGFQMHGIKSGPKTPDQLYTLPWERWANPSRPPDNPRAGNVVRFPVPPGGYRMGRSP